MRASFLKVRRTAAVLGAVIAIALVAGRTQAQDGYKIGVIPFVDNTGSGGEDLATALSRAVQAEIAHSTQLQGRAIALGNGVTAASVDAAKALQIGRDQNVDVIMLGTVLEASSQQTSKSINGPSIGGFGGIHIGGSANTVKAVVTLQGDLFDVTSGGKIDSIRVTGNASQKSAGSDLSSSLGDISNGSNFDGSAIGKAFHSAVADLVKKIAADQSKMTHFAGASAPVIAAAMSPAPAPAPAQAPAQPAVAVVAPPAAGAAAGGDQPQLSTAKIDFVPGERTVFFDDFSDMIPDEPPPHWKLRGNPVELHTGPGVRELYSRDSQTLTSASIPVPVDFTFETEWTGTGQFAWSFRDKADDAVLEVIVRGESDGNTANTSITQDGPGGGPLGNGGIETDTSKPVKFALWVQRGRLRAYMNGQRLVDVNQVNIAQVDHLVVDAGGFRPTGLRSVRLAEAAPDFSAMMGSSGRYVTHGIFFDTDSDHLQPESAPVIKMVAQGLERNPNLKLEVDGFTDSVGNAAHNLDLSKRRAEAVRSVLVAQFGIDAGRLTSSGFGADKPVGSNDTPDGRAANRRVEFVKQ